MGQDILLPETGSLKDKTMPDTQYCLQGFAAYRQNRHAQAMRYFQQEPPAQPPHRRRSAADRRTAVAAVSGSLKPVGFAAPPTVYPVCRFGFQAA
nr:hypothetical protein [uncultured Kingella sp.]